MPQSNLSHLPPFSAGIVQLPASPAPCRSALSMLAFDINRAGKTLPKTRRDRQRRAKTELKRRFGIE